MEFLNISILINKVLVDVIVNNNESIIFKTETESYIMFHDQECCEQVFIDDINGDITDLIGKPILIAEELESHDLSNKYNFDESYSWTFYKIATCKGYVDIRWYGGSNGYYSESVDFMKIETE